MKTLCVRVIQSYRYTIVHLSVGNVREGVRVGTLTASMVRVGTIGPDSLEHALFNQGRRSQG